MKQTRMSDRQIAFDLIKNASTKEERMAKKSYIITRLVWGLLCLYYTVEIVIPRFMGTLVIDNEWTYVIRIIVPAIMLAIMEILWVGKPWHDYLRKVKNQCK